VLDYSTIEAGKLRLEVVDMDLRGLLREVVDLHTGEAAAKSVDILLFMPDALPVTLRGDPARLRQVLSNVVGNAVKFTQKGEVTVRVTSADRGAGSIDLRFEIRDTGIGIASDRLDGVFEVFSQADSSMTREYSGTGLGLAVCKRLVTLMGGQIGVESEPGVGSTFWITCPLEVSETEVSESARIADPEGLRVLIVTDDTAILQILRHHLTDWKVDHRSASDADAALDVVRSKSVSADGFDLVIVDDALAGSDALSLVRGIRSQDSSGSTEIVVLSAVGRSDQARGAGEAGIHAYLTKPILAPRLRACVESVAARIPRLATSEANADTPVGGRVLLVEDSLVNQEVCQAMMESAGITVDLANNGREGVEMATSRSYDAILMDLQMPGMDGLEATCRIRDHEASGDRPPRRTRIIALSANATSDDREKASAAGMDDFVSKPFSQEQLLAALRRGRPVEAPLPEFSDRVPDVAVDGLVAVDLPVREAIDYDSLLHRCMGKEDLAHRLIGKFRNGLEEDVARIKSLLEEQDWEEASRAAHKVKGAAAALEATELRACLEDLERNLRRGIPVDVDLVTAELVRTSSDYHKAAEKILGGSPGPVAGDANANSRR
jgi:CheY-like chemotaxis protein/HPt (histidine-containing phosphotransfer) domain-containing protein